MNDNINGSLLQKSQALGETLKTQNYQISAAESCTGGLFLSTLTDISGSSAYVQGGVVTYSNEAKQQHLNVQEQTLIDYGAVSEQTAREMVIGVCQLFNVPVGASITGIAGPGGGTAEKPVGLVYIGIKVNDTLQVNRHVWNGTRIENKIYSVHAAIDSLLALLS
ncbi:MAG: CinA family protein [Chloroflexota bacterium]